MADALVSGPVAAAAGIVAASLIVISSRKVSRMERDDLMPLMGVLGAFVFAAQMINFSIPGTGSSGHIIGGVLLAALLGPWAAFLTLCSVLIIQCLLFADGGLMALGCNIVNMAGVSCLLAYSAIYRPIAGKKLNRNRIFWASVAACVLSLETGAVLVTAETELSGITALHMREFLMLMLPVNFVTGVCEGVATGLLLLFVASYKPDILFPEENIATRTRHKMAKKTRTVLIIFSVLALIFAASFTWLASSAPDTLEWSIERLAGASAYSESVVSPTAVMPEYNSTFAGLLGGVIVMLMVWGISRIILHRRHVKA